MRGGKLDKIITIETFTSTVDEWNQPVEQWTLLGTFRAQIVQASTEEFFRAQGVTESVAVIFRTRFVDGVTLASRITWNGQQFNIAEIKELGRRQGLDLRAVASIGGAT